MPQEHIPWGSFTATSFSNETYVNYILLKLQNLFLKKAIKSPWEVKYGIFENDMKVRGKY